MVFYQMSDTDDESLPAGRQGLRRNERPIGATKAGIKTN